MSAGGTWYRDLSLGGNGLDASSMFDLNSVIKGARPAPAMTTAQRDNISSPIGGLQIFNTDDQQYQYFDGNSFTWKPFGSGGTWFQEKIGTGNGVQTTFVLTFVPSNDTSILVMATGAKEVVTDWNYSSGSNSIVFTSAVPAGVSVYVVYATGGSTLTVPVPSGTQYVVYKQVTNTDETNKNFTLPSSPLAPANTLVDIIGAGPQYWAIDFTITGTLFNWNGLGLDGDLLENDIVRLMYFT